MQVQMNQKQMTIYEDNNVTVTKKQIIIKDYYSTTPQPKTISFQEIYNIQYIYLPKNDDIISRLGRGKWAYWCSNQRIKNDHFIAISVIKDSQERYIRKQQKLNGQIIFTCNNHKKVFDQISKIFKQGKQKSQNASLFAEIMKKINS